MGGQCQWRFWADFKVGKFEHEYKQHEVPATVQLVPAAYLLTNLRCDVSLSFFVRATPTQELAAGGLLKAGDGDGDPYGR